MRQKATRRLAAQGSLPTQWKRSTADRSRWASVAGRRATLPEIKRAFRRAAMRWHPDRNALLPELERLQAEVIFKQINLANEVLTDAAKRR